MVICLFLSFWYDTQITSCGVVSTSGLTVWVLLSFLWAYHTVCVHGLYIAPFLLANLPATMWRSIFHALFRVYPIVFTRQPQTLAKSEEHQRQVCKVHNAIAEGYNASTKYSVGYATVLVPVLYHERSRGEKEQCCRQADHQDLDTRTLV